MLSNTAQSLINRRLAMKTVGHRLPRNRRVPRPLQPTGIEREYYLAITKLIEPLFKGVNEKLIPAIPDIIRMHKEETRVDSIHTDMVMGYGQLITRTISDIRVGIYREMPTEIIQKEATDIAHRVGKFNLEQVNRQFKSVLGINPLLTERWLEPKIAAFVENNVSFIKSIPEQSLGKIEGLVRNTVERGISTSKLEGQVYEELGGMIHNQLEMTRSRAHLIARDQIAKYNGKLTELRQTEVGVKKYIWSTSRDERVRPKHAAMDGKVVSWDDPPPVGNNGERLHPGEDYQCRCVALPILEEFLK